MKRHAAVAVLVLFATVLVSADTTRVVTGNVLNLYSLNRTTFPTYSTPCSVPTDTLNRYDFIYHFFDGCTCICPCCPIVKITSPRSFYISNAPMNYNQFNPLLLSQQFTLISGPDNPLYPCSLPSLTFGSSGYSSSKPLDSMRNRLFVFLSNNGGALPFYVYMLVHVDTLLPRMEWCNPNDPLPGGQYYSLYDTARISIYAGPIASVKPAGKTEYIRTVPKGLEVYTIFGKRIANSRAGKLPAGIYVVNGRVRFLQRNTPLSNLLNSAR